jgi:hypothetical protein
MLDKRSLDLLQMEQNSLRGAKHRLKVHMDQAVATNQAYPEVPYDDLEAAIGALERVQATIETVLHIEEGPF